MFLSSSSSSCFRHPLLVRPPSLVHLPLVSTFLALFILTKLSCLVFHPFFLSCSCSLRRPFAVFCSSSLLISRQCKVRWSTNATSLSNILTSSCRHPFVAFAVFLSLACDSIWFLTENLFMESGTTLLLHDDLGCDVRNRYSTRTAPPIRRSY